ncbi:hypothetical protein ACWGJ2_14460 [Streptomyces sp. NPDC054796]
MGARVHRRSGTGRWRGALLAVALLAGLCSCGGAPDEGAAWRDRLQSVLDAQATAVRAGDESAYLAGIAPGADAYRADQRRVFANLERLPLAAWSYRITRVRDTGGGSGGSGGSEGYDGAAARAEADVELRYRLRGYDHSPVTATERFAFTREDGRWYVSSQLSGGDRQLWDQGRVTAVRGEHSLVLGVGRDSSELRALSRVADRAVPAVNAVWPRSWAARVVVEVPGSLERMAELLKAPASSYQGIAAVTTGEAGASEDAPADRVVVNPDAYGLLSEDGRQVVMTHETVHVATRAHTSDATPLWLSEGLADWAGYRGTSRTPQEAAPELARTVRTDDAPRALPDDADFRFGSDPEALGRAYEGGWLACRMVAERWGEGRLMELYLRTGRGEEKHEGDGTGVDGALREVLGVTKGEFTRQWRAYVRQELS